MKTDFYEIKKVINGIKVHLHVSTHKIYYHFFLINFPYSPMTAIKV